VRAHHAAAPLRVQQRSAGGVSNRQRASRLVASAAAAADAEVLDTVVVGAGISGLVTAQALTTRHGGEVGRFLVTEGRERVGGNITSLQADGYVWEEGPNSFQPNDAMLQAAVRAWRAQGCWDFVLLLACLRASSLACMPCLITARSRRR
jgi:hypothetical protein